MKSPENSIREAVVVIATDENRSGALLQCSEVQGLDTLGMPGDLRAEKVPLEQQAQDLAKRFLALDLDPVPIGQAVEIINKPGARVRLIGHVFRFTLSSKEVLEIAKRDDWVWLAKDEIKSEVRLREGDREILARCLNSDKINFEIEEDQFEKWRDAKMLSVREL